MPMMYLSGLGQWPFGMPVPGPFGLPHPAFYIWWANYWIGVQREWAETWLRYLENLEGQKRHSALVSQLLQQRSTDQ